jgi:hypothetical protein
MGARTGHEALAVGCLEPTASPTAFFTSFFGPLAYGMVWYGGGGAVLPGRLSFCKFRLYKNFNPSRKSANSYFDRTNAICGLHG